ncbi:MAG TPA: hypothetical protein VFL73_04520 [Solirubrobacteraceae bacterium]|jgi:hypothetical protein|nr:hypothetical protein [Solirubrobacteraceae bacterium]
MRNYTLTQLLAVAGAFVVITTFAFGTSAATSIDFAISIGAVLAGLAIARGVSLGIGLSTVVVGAWSILVTLGIFSGSTQRWLDFAAGAAFAVAGLAAGALAARSEGAQVSAPTSIRVAA